MPKTHFDPYINSHDDCFSEVAICGTPAPEDYDGTGDWKYVTCRHCLNKKDRIIASLEEQEKMIAKQMGDMADWYATELQKEQDVARNPQS